MGLRFRRGVVMMVAGSTDTMFRRTTAGTRRGRSAEVRFPTWRGRRCAGTPPIPYIIVIIPALIVGNPVSVIPAISVFRDDDHSRRRRRRGRHGLNHNRRRGRRNRFYYRSGRRGCGPFGMMWWWCGNQRNGKPADTECYE